MEAAMSRMGTGYGGQPRRINPRLILALIIGGIAVAGYFLRTSINPVTGEKQHLAMTVDQEIAMGLQSAPEMAAEFGGPDPDSRKTALAERVGQSLVAAIPKAGDVYPFAFHVLADTKTVNAFALPGGQVFITAALFDRLQTEGQLAGVLGHEVGHVVHRHSAEHMAKAGLIQGVTGAVVVGATDPNNPNSRGIATAAMMVGQMVNLKYGRNDESESDRSGIEYMVKAGYDPRSMVRVMEILKEASGGGHQPEWMSSHPDPGNRAEAIAAQIKSMFPQGVPAGLKE
jgi:predicted Zn-dependent protease